MAEPSSKPALVKNPSTGSGRKPGRRVAFQVPSYPHRNSSLSDIHTSIDHFDKGRQRPCCFACCAWACIVVFILIIAFLFVGISYLAFLRSGMPIVNVRQFNITKLQVDNNSQKMDAVINLMMRFSNKNEKIKLLYGSLYVDVSSEDVPLGKSKVNRFSQVAKNETDLNITMKMGNAYVNKYAADDLQSDINADEMVFDVYVSGNIGVQIGKLHMINVPFLSSCHQIKRKDVDLGRRPECDVRMFTSRSSTN